MMKQKTSKIVAGVTIGSVLIFGLLLGFTVWEMGECQNTYLQQEQAEQEELCNIVKKQIQDYDLAYKTELAGEQRMQEGIYQNVLLPLSNGNKQFFIVGLGAQLVFYQNEELTHNRKNYRMSDLWQEYNRNGASDIDVIEKMTTIQKPGSVSYHPSSENTEYMAYVDYVTVGQLRYTIIYTEDANWLLKQAGIQKFAILLFVELVLCGLILVAGSCISVQLYRQSQQDMYDKEKELERKNTLIMHLNRKLHPEDESDYYGSSKDSQTGLYNEEFAQNLLANLDARGVLPVYLAVLHGRTNRKGREQGWQPVAQVLQDMLNSNQILLHIDAGHLAVLGLKQTEQEFTQQIMLAVDEVQKQFTHWNLQMKVGFGTKSQSDENVMEVLQRTLEQTASNQ